MRTQTRAAGAPLEESRLSYIKDRINECRNNGRDAHRVVDELESYPEEDLAVLLRQVVAHTEDLPDEVVHVFFSDAIEFLQRFLLEQDIEILGLDLSDENRLRRATHARTVGQLVSRIQSREELISCRNMGEKTADRVISALEAHHLELGQDIS